MQQHPHAAGVDKLAASPSPSQSILDWGSSIMNMSPFKSGGGVSSGHSGAIHNPIQHSTPMHGNASSAVKATPKKRVAYIAIQFSNFNEK